MISQESSNAPRKRLIVTFHHKSATVSAQDAMMYSMQNKVHHVHSKGFKQFRISIHVILNGIKLILGHRNRVQIRFHFMSHSWGFKAILQSKTFALAPVSRLRTIDIYQIRSPYEPGRIDR